MKLDENQKQAIRDAAADYTYVSPKEVEFQLRQTLMGYAEAHIRRTIQVLNRYLRMNGGLG